MDCMPVWFGCGAVAGSVISLLSPELTPCIMVGAAAGLGAADWLVGCVGIGNTVGEVVVFVIVTGVDVLGYD